jgi:hypothetical protein
LRRPTVLARVEEQQDGRRRNHYRDFTHKNIPRCITV